MRVIFGGAGENLQEKSDSDIWFCNKERCSREVFSNLPAVFEVFSPLGCGILYLGENGKTFSQHTNVILGKDEAVVFFEGESEVCIFQSEFACDILHTVWGYRHHAIISCETATHVCSGRHFQSCDCISTVGKTYIFLKFASTLACFLFQNGEYTEIFHIPCTHFEISQNSTATFKFSPKISSGGAIISNINIINTDLSQFSYQNFEIPRPNNYNFHTFPNHFFETLLLSRFLQSSKVKQLLSPLLSPDLQKNTDGILQFIGEFCGVVPCVDSSVILLYQQSQNHFEARAFQLEILYSRNGEPYVDNITELDNFQFPDICFGEITKLFVSI